MAESNEPDTSVSDIDDIEDESPAIVIDNGSFQIFAGFAGDDAPRSVIQSVVGGLRNANYQIGHSNIADKRSFFVGDEAYYKKGIASLKYPIERGRITDWDNMDQLWRATFADLRTDSYSQDVLLTEHPLTSKSQREKCTQIMFETLKTSRFYVAISAQLSCYAAGRTTGLVLESGYGVTHAVPMYEGYVLPHAVQRVDIGGSDITEYLVKTLKVENSTFASMFGSSSDPNSSEREMVSDIKQKLCYVALDYSDDLEKAEASINLEAAYELPDGQRITINKERFECTEIMFDPYKIGNEEEGIHSLLDKSIRKCDEDIRKDLWGNIVLSGGNTLLEGFDTRFAKEVRKLAPDAMTVKVIAPPERKYLAWIGGSILASLATFEDMWITKQEYDESGPSIVHRKCT